MRHWVMAAVILAPLSTGMETRGSNATEIEITFLNHGTFTGEILAVRDSSIVIATQCGLSETEMVVNPKWIFMIPNSRIATVQTVASSHVAVGMGVGLVLGCVTGCAIGANKEENVKQEKNDIFGCNAEAEKETGKIENMSNGALIGGLAGAVVGGVVGASASEGRKLYITPQTQRDFGLLRPLARYNVEPEFLRTIVKPMKPPDR